ncbi:UDP-2,4-diacetamido-2,4,6-trideoxy-beta-L-altropyranose hydrolase [Enterobacter ludwigii]|uniref:UDP-2,4-diacetamido-2,4, 6-trideoxy-beta-L-altropyranose hydrolase n=1 Tax=Enterobacter ludwigii TaxID=299767 RepID=UPI002B4C078A|nr:UDP-2,4-diacetamido-2,4,6-trideoxy-beta-L-altropyranose hydrolase [Enterobacter ludwigii]WRM03296.1 UDP-2,4-diacetamido-2,4,6-trideoxy-beta-L-altropyranose hydrolase [Enterobacter ludwigii]HDR2456737.1 UDP-2,4-diacetamido-2,4,6-trideoxy-beta-L-altropyranose hydrolase [Enterobacter ludwigii]HDR2566698.1 UDP-2,4-diacetamido-2,4,6-trideoxy-beta-L-altropyranose hydrolase [Enterobacter ludwigii]
MNVFLRADSSLSIGSGHIIRCLNLAKALKKAGAHCIFISKNHHGNILGKITQGNFPLKVIPVLDRTGIYVRDEKSWLDGNQSDDAEQFVSLVSESCLFPDIIIVDHYSLDREWETIVKARFPESYLVVIDDLCNRPHCGDLLIDQTYQRTAKEYLNLNGNDGNILAGTKFALIHPIFAQLRNQSVSRKANITLPKKLMLTMGGVDAQNITGKILDFLEQVDFDNIEKITIILGAACPHSAEISTLGKKSKYCVEVLINISNMAELMLEHDFAIGAMGGTTWERCAMGLPAVNIAIADNQRTIANNLAEAGAIVLNAEKFNASELRCALTHLITHYHEQRLLAMNICDGQGLIRVIQEIILIPAKDGINVTLRKASCNDIDFVYQLQCEPKTRQFARNPEIPEYKNHVKWMQSKLDNGNTFFYIIEHDEECGVIRLDPVENSVAKYEISIFLSSSSHGKGIASAAIKRTLMLHNDIVILATVLPENYASHQLFERLGFLKISPSEYIIERK